MKPIAESELILNSDRSVYHLQLNENEIAETIITVGDPARVKEVSKHFDKIKEALVEKMDNKPSPAHKPTMK